jgi:flagellar basal body rod protein FlgC
VYPLLWRGLHVEVEYSRVPCKGEYITVGGDDQNCYRVDFVIHPGLPTAQNEGEVFVTRVDYMTEMAKAFPKEG